MDYAEIQEAKRSLENVSLLTHEEVRTLNRALNKLRSGSPLSRPEEAACEMVLRLSESIFHD